MNREQLEAKLYELCDDELDSYDGVVIETENKDIVDAVMKVIPRSSLEQVKEFHKTMGLEYSDTPVPTIPTQDICELRVNLIFEELIELVEAMGIEYHLVHLAHQYLEQPVFTKSSRYGKVKVLDALVDLRYVLDGTVVSCQMEDIHDEAFEEVHSSNMSKACVDMDDAYSMLAKLPTDYKYKVINNSGNIIIRREDGKIIKPDSYRKAELTQFFED